eukprot:Awhi_evm2s809
MTYPTYPSPAPSPEWRYDVVPAPTPIEIYILGNIYTYCFLFCQLIVCVLIPSVIIKSLESYKRWKEDKTETTRNNFYVIALYTLWNILAIISGLVDFVGVFTNNNQKCYDTPFYCTVPSNIQRLGSTFCQFFGSSIAFVYVLRFYAFVENMITLQPSKLELKTYFWYSILSVFVYLLLFTLTEVEIIVQQGMPISQVYHLVENVVLEGLLLLMLWRLRKVNSEFLNHPMLIVFKESTVLLCILNLFRLGAQGAVVYFGLGTIATLYDAYNTILTGILHIITDAFIISLMNLMTARVGSYFDKNAGNKTNKSNTSGSAYRTSGRNGTDNIAIGTESMVSINPASNNEKSYCDVLSSAGVISQSEITVYDGEIEVLVFKT